MNPTLRHPHHILPKTIRQPERRLQIHLERFQIPRIHSDQIASRIQRSLQLCFVMHFAQNVQAIQPRAQREPIQFRVRQSCPTSRLVCEMWELRVLSYAESEPFLTRLPIHVPHSLYESAHFLRIFFAWSCFDAGSHIHSPRPQNSDCLADVAGLQASRDHNRMKLIHQ